MMTRGRGGLDTLQKWWRHLWTTPNSMRNDCECVHLSRETHSAQAKRRWLNKLTAWLNWSYKAMASHFQWYQFTSITGPCLLFLFKSTWSCIKPAKPQDDSGGQQSGGRPPSSPHPSQHCHTRSHRCLAGVSDLAAPTICRPLVCWGGTKLG